jgi:RNA polymerase sigma-70 factor (ECF subfamily)
MNTTVERARRGDAAAFEQLYHEHSGWVYALARRMAQDETMAKDLTQEIFIRLWRKLESFRGESEFTTWFRRMAINLCLNKLGDEKRRTARVFTTDDVTPFEAPTRPGAQAPEAGIDLERAIATLPQGARNVFVLHDVEGYKHSEIAQMTGVAEGTVKAQLHRARKLLQAAMSR